MIKSLQSLRLVFAIMIFLHHFHYNGEGLFLAGGPLGVCFFIMLSGFVMSIGYGEKTLSETFDFKSYYKKRIIRLWPLHLLCLFAFVMMNIPECVSSFKHIGLLGINALMLQSWIPIKGVYFSGNAVSWCLCDLMFCYLMFPLLFRAISKTSTKHLSIVFMMGLAGYFTALQFIPDGMTHAFVYISPIFRLCDFIIGILAYKVYQSLRNSRLKDWIQNSSKITLTLVEIFLIALLLLCIVLYPSIAKTYSLTSMWWPICCGLIVMFTLLNTYGGGVFVGYPSEKVVAQSVGI